MHYNRKQYHINFCLVEYTKRLNILTTPRGPNRMNSELIMENPSISEHQILKEVVGGLVYLTWNVAKYNWKFNGGSCISISNSNSEFHNAELIHVAAESHQCSAPSLQKARGKRNRFVVISQLQFIFLGHFSSLVFFITFPGPLVYSGPECFTVNSFHKGFIKCPSVSSPLTKLVSGMKKVVCVFVLVRKVNVTRMQKDRSNMLGKRGSKAQHAANPGASPAKTRDNEAVNISNPLEGVQAGNTVANTVRISKVKVEQTDEKRIWESRLVKSLRAISNSALILEYEIEDMRKQEYGVIA